MNLDKLLSRNFNLMITLKLMINFVYESDQAIEATGLSKVIQNVAIKKIHSLSQFLHWAVALSLEQQWTYSSLKIRREICLYLR